MGEPSGAYEAARTPKPDARVEDELMSFEAGGTSKRERFFGRLGCSSGRSVEASSFEDSMPGDGGPCRAGDDAGGVST